MRFRNGNIVGTQTFVLDSQLFGDAYFMLQTGSHQINQALIDNNLYFTYNLAYRFLSSG